MAGQEACTGLVFIRLLINSLPLPPNCFAAQETPVYKFYLEYIQPHVYIVTTDYNRLRIVTEQTESLNRRALMMKDEQKSQVVSVRLSADQLEFLNQLKSEMEEDMETEISMATVVRRILSRYISKHTNSAHLERHKRFETLESRVAALEAQLASLAADGKQ
ncbi:hypothetical protein C4K68_03355 [Pokkaliibacter plantistimulans]|uniref:Uncharacterized protein n=3 Tax=Pseudomonadota TaxID=1224 RepID=A0A2S5KVK4_9PROT|nr:hypothetical protein C4K68_03355 [Pokkaliibacter plantistimulans]